MIAQSPAHCILLRFFTFITSVAKSFIANVVVNSINCLSYPTIKHSITKTCPCNVYPPEPHFYIAKLGYAGVYLFFLFLLQNIDCGYTLEPPRYIKVGLRGVFITRTCFSDVITC